MKVVTLKDVQNDSMEGAEPIEGTQALFPGRARRSSTLETLPTITAAS